MVWLSSTLLKWLEQQHCPGKTEYRSDPVLWVLAWYNSHSPNVCFLEQCKSFLGRNNPLFYLHPDTRSDIRSHSLLLWHVRVVCCLHLYKNSNIHQHAATSKNPNSWDDHIVNLVACEDCVLHHYRLHLYKSIST